MKLGRAPKIPSSKSPRQRSCIARFLADFSPEMDDKLPIRCNKRQWTGSQASWRSWTATDFAGR